MRKLALLALPAFVLAACAGSNLANVPADVQAVSNDVVAMETGITASVPSADLPKIEAYFQAISTAGTSPLAIVADIVDLGALLQAVVPDFQTAITNDTAAVGPQFQQLQADFGKLKADLGISGKTTLAAIRAKVAR